MKVRRVVRQRVRRRRAGLNAAMDVNAVVAVNVGERGARTAASSGSTVRVQTDDRSRRTSPN